jgi:hypothetical protein
MVKKMDVNEKIVEVGMIRSSEEIAAAVNRGLACAMFDGVAAGAAIMREGGVPLHVSARVLINPHQRRKSDWQQAAESLSLKLDR